MENYFDRFDGEPASTASPVTSQNPAPNESQKTENYFDQFDAPKQEANFFDKFDDPNSKPAQEDRGWINNGIRGAGKFINDMGAGIVDLAGAAAASTPTGIVGAPTYAAGQYKQLTAEEQKKVGENYHKTAEDIRNLDTGFMPNLNTLDEAQKDWKQGNRMAAIGRGARAIGEAAIQSAPAIAGTIVAPEATIPVLGLGTTGDMANNRAKNKGLDRPTSTEVGQVAPYAAAITALDSVLPIFLRRFDKGITEKAAGEITKSAKLFMAKKVATGAAAGAAEESLTEGTQQLLQYVGEKYGTDAKMSLEDAWHQTWQAAVLGGGVGGPLGGAHHFIEGQGQVNSVNAKDANSDGNQVPSETQPNNSIIEDLPPAPVEAPQPASINPDETLAANSQPAPGAFSGVADYANQQAESERQAAAAERTAYLDEDTSLASAASKYGEQQGFIKKSTLQETPDDVQNSLDQFTSVDDEINQLLSDISQHHQTTLDNIEKVNASHQEHASRIFDDLIAANAAKQAVQETPTAFDKRDESLKAVNTNLEAGIDRARDAQMPENLRDVRLLRDRYRNHLTTIANSIDEHGDAFKNNDGLLELAAKNGGLNTDVWAKEGVDPADTTKNKAFSKNGKLTPDDLAELAHQNGYLGFANAQGTPDANAALNAIRDEMSGAKKHYSTNDEKSLQAAQLAPAFIKELKGFGSPEAIKTAIAKSLQGKKLGSNQVKIVQEVLDRTNAHTRDDAAIKTKWEDRAKSMLANKGNRHVEEWRNREDHQPEITTHEAALTEIMTEAMQQYGIDPDKVKAAYEKYSKQYPKMNQLTAAMIGWVSANKTDSSEHLNYGRERELPRGSSSERGSLEKQSGLSFERSSSEAAAAPERTERAAPSERGSDSAGRDAGLRQPVDSSAIDQAAHQAATSPQNNLPEPTLAQKEAGNYQKGHVSIHGLDISIENPKGSTRSGTDPNGKKWETKMHSHYGYIRSFNPVGTRELVKGAVTYSKAFSDTAKAHTGIPKASDFSDVIRILQSCVSALNSSYSKGFAEGGLGNSDSKRDLRTTNAFIEQINSVLNIPREIRDSPSIKVALNKAASDGASADANLFGDSSTAQAIRSKGFDSLSVESKLVVQRHMLATLKNLKVFRSIIQLVPVDVVNMLTGRQFSSDSILHDKAMLLNALAAPLDHPVKIGGFIDAVASSHPIAFASSVAKKIFDASGHSFGRSEDGSITEATGNHLHARTLKKSKNYNTTVGADGDHIDVFVGPNPESEKVFVVDQINQDGSFDEHKVMLGYDSLLRAKAGYSKNYTKGWRVGPIKSMSIGEFKDWLKSGETKKPFAELPSNNDSSSVKSESSASTDSKPKEISEDAPLTTKGTKLVDKATETISDFGEKLEGAKKDTRTLRAALSDQNIDTARVPLSKSFPQPDYEKLAKAGVPHEVLAFVAQLRAEIKSKPKRGVKLWSDTVNAMRSFANDLLDGSISIESVVTEMRPKGSYIKNIPDIIGLANEILPSQIKELGNYKLEEHHFSIYKDERNVKKWVVTNNSEKGGGFSRGGKETNFDTKDEALAFIKSEVSTMDGENKPFTKFDVWTVGREKGVWVGKKLGTYKYIELKKFDELREAKDYIATHNDELVELLKHKKHIGSERRAEQNERIGKDYRRGVNVTKDLFDATFGFRGVQFGNYVENDKRQQDLNNAYDGLLDLADVLGIPPQAISLNGELGLAFGARGNGGKDPASAHYESGKVVINLTKVKGAGSLAHEWWHALDNYFAKKGDFKDKVDAFITEKDRPKRKEIARDGRRALVDVDPNDFGIRPEVYDAFKNIVNVIKNKTQLFQRSSILDGRKTKDYWTTTRELTARTFERFVIDELKAKGFESDYLATILPKGAWDATESLFGNEKQSYPYPTDEEAKLTNAAYKNLFDTLETQQTETGVALFSRKKSSTESKGMQPEKVRSIIDEFLKKYKGADDVKVEVHETAETLPDYRAERDSGSTIEGQFDPESNTLHIVAGSFDPENKASLESVIREELLVHKGLGLFSEEERQSIYKSIQNAAKQSDEVAKLWEETERNYRDIADQLNLSDAERKNYFAEELLGTIAQKKINPLTKGFTQIFIAVKRLMVKLGVLKASDGMLELRNIVYQMGDAFARGHRAEKRDVKNDIGNTPQYSINNSGNQTRSGGFSLSGLKEKDFVFGISLDGLLRVWQDKMRPLLRTQEAIKAEGGTISEEQNAYLYEEAFHGKTENDLRKMKERFLEPMAEKMAKYGIEREDLDMYLWAKHAEERNNHIAKINPEMPDGGSGMTTAQANEVLQKAKSEGKLKQLEELAGTVYSLLDEKRKIARYLAGGEVVDSWDNAYKYYVPLKGRAVDDSGPDYPRVGKGFDIRGKESLRALGRRTKPESPTLHAIKDTTDAIIRYRKNEVGNALLALVEENPNPEYWEVYDSSNPEFERKLLKKGGKEYVGSAKVTTRDDYFITKRDGKEYWIRIEDALLMRAMKNMGPEKMNWAVKQLAKASRFLSAMCTSFNPEFVVTNFARDIQTAIINLQAEIDLHDGKAAGKKITSAMIKGVPSAMRAVYASLNGKQLSGDLADWKQSFDDFRNDGANTGWYQLKDIDQQAEELESLINAQKRDTKGFALRAMQGISKFVQNTNATVENAIRLSVYKSAVDAGITRKQAASLAKNLTVNFNRKGEIGASMNALYMFFNASVQGTASLARALGTLKVDANGKRKLNMAQKAAVGIMLASYGLAALNRSSAGDDDDDKNWWDKVPDYEKERNIIIMKSVLGGEKNGSYWKIPLPYGYNIFNAAANISEAAVSGKMGIGKASGGILSAILGAFSPIGVAKSNTTAGEIVRTAAPTVLKPLADLTANENFFGSRIYAENVDFDTPKPASHLSMRSTNEFWKWTAEFMNDATGGSSYRSGAVDISPDKMGYIFNYFMGSAGKFYSDALTVGIRTAEDRKFESREIPFVRRFTGDVSWHGSQTDFYKRKEKIDQVVEEFKSLHGAEEKAQYKKDHGELLHLAFRTKATAKKLSDIRKRKNNIIDDKTLTEKEKDNKIEEYDHKTKAILDSFNKAYDERVKD